MQGFHQLLASVAFAAHALLGCGVHHACCVAKLESPANCHWHLAGAAGHDAPCHPGEAPQPHRDSCQHVPCSFTKAEVVRIEKDTRKATFQIALPTSAAAHSIQTCEAVGEPFRSAPSTSTALYVWHCKLLI